MLYASGTARPVKLIFKVKTEPFVALDVERRSDSAEESMDKVCVPRRGEILIKLA
jgi:hypothetical protein